MAMQLASYGTRGVGARSLARALGLLKPPSNSPSQTTKNLISRFVSHLTAPGLAAPRIANHGRATSIRHFSGATGNVVHGRHALSLARGPRFHIPHGSRLPVSRGVGDVGLGAARKFSSSGPLFAVVENVPILLRAGSQIEWDTKQKRRENKKRPPSKQDSATLIARSFEAVKFFKAPVSATAEDYNTYFAQAAKVEEECTTTLVVPLLPARRALGHDQSSWILSEVGDTRLLDFQSLASTHEAHTKHRMRVSTLFARLDLANVWTLDGVVCNPYTVASPGEGNAQATHLKIMFPGWSASRVRKVIGDSGLGWCDLTETTTTSAPSIGIPENSGVMHDSFEDHTVADTLILPTIDLSNTDTENFFATSSESSDDWFAESDWENDGFVPAPVQPTASSRLGFSASFASSGNRTQSWDDDWTSSDLSD